MATSKQKLALEKIVENHGNVSAGMRQAGYAPATIENPKNLTTSKGFQRLIAAMDELSRRKYGLDSDIKAVDVYTDALAAEKVDITGDKHPDHKTRIEAADRVLEVQGLKKEINNQFNIGGDVSIKFTREDGSIVNAQ